MNVRTATAPMLAPLRLPVAPVTDDVVTLHEQLADTRRHRDTALRDIADVRKQLERERAATCAACAETEALRRDCASLGVDLTVAEAELERARDEIAVLLAEIERLRAKDVTVAVEHLTVRVARCSAAGRVCSARPLVEDEDTDAVGGRP